MHGVLNPLNSHKSTWLSAHTYSTMSFFSVCRKDLVREMDTRLCALQQEQDMVLSQSTAAAFSEMSAADLLIFFDHSNINWLKYANFMDLYLFTTRLKSGKVLKLLSTFM